MSTVLVIAVILVVLWVLRLAFTVERFSTPSIPVRDYPIGPAHARFLRTKSDEDREAYDREWWDEMMALREAREKGRAKSRDLGQ
jgi:hypothetical protein